MSSSELFLFEDSFIPHSSDMGISILPDFNLQFSSPEPIFPFHHQFPPSPITKNPFLSPSSSPPNQEFNNLSLTNGNPSDQLHSMVPTSAIFGNGGFSSDLIKTEDCFDYSSFQAPEFTTTTTTEKLMQRSFSSHSLDQKPGFLFQPNLDSLMEVPDFSKQIVGSPENSIFNRAMRRVCSTGDLQRFKRTHSSHGYSLAAENNTLYEEVSFKARPYNAEEKKQRIHRYRSKRTQRNFNKTIKYACRKTLADSRPRVRGRFARNDETGEIPKVTGFNREEDDEDELWIHEEMGFDEKFMNNIRNENQYFGSSYVGSCSLSWKGLSPAAAQMLSSDL